MDVLMRQGLELMGYGVAGVFLVLIAFMVFIKLLTVVFPVKDDEDNK